MESKEECRNEGLSQNLYIALNKASTAGCIASSARESFELAPYFSDSLLFLKDLQQKENLLFSLLSLQKFLNFENTETMKN